MENGFPQKSREERDELYSPSKYSKKYSADYVVDHHVKVTKQLTDDARSSPRIRCELNTEYGANGMCVDIYYPLSCDDPSDVMLYFHGGYWQALSKDNAGFTAVPLTTNGITLIALDYELAPHANMTKIVEQCRRGCVFARERFPNARLTVCGHSAGAHLAACMLTTRWSDYGLPVFPFSNAVLLSGVYDLSPIKLCYVNDNVHLTDEEVMLYSPQFLVDQLPQLPKSGFCCVMAEGEQESPEFKRQRQEYQQALESRNIHCVHKQVKDEDHFSVVEKLSDPNFSLTKIILQNILTLK